MDPDTIAGHLRFVIAIGDGDLDKVILPQDGSGNIEERVITNDVGLAILTIFHSHDGAAQGILIHIDHDGAAKVDNILRHIHLHADLHIAHIAGGALGISALIDILQISRIDDFTVFHDSQEVVIGQCQAGGKGIDIGVRTLIGLRFALTVVIGERIIQEVCNGAIGVRSFGPLFCKIIHIIAFLAFLITFARIPDYKLEGALDRFTIQRVRLPLMAGLLVRQYKAIVVNAAGLRYTHLRHADIQGIVQRIANGNSHTFRIRRIRLFVGHTGEDLLDLRQLLGGKVNIGLTIAIVATFLTGISRPE